MNDSFAESDCSWSICVLCQAAKVVCMYVPTKSGNLPLIKLHNDTFEYNKNIVAFINLARYH